MEACKMEYNWNQSWSLWCHTKVNIITEDKGRRDIFAYWYPSRRNCISYCQPDLTLPNLVGFIYKVNVGLPISVLKYHIFWSVLATLLNFVTF